MISYENDGGGSSKKAPSNDILYIASFLGSVILINWFAGNKATYYYLLLVLVGVAMVNTGKYNIRVVTPEILENKTSTGSSRSW